MASKKSSPLHIAARVAAGVLGAYAFAWGFATLSIALLLWAGRPYDEAKTLIALLTFPVLLWMFCWSFAAASLARAWAVLAGGALAMSGAAWLLSRTSL